MVVVTSASRKGNRLNHLLAHNDVFIGGSVWKFCAILLLTIQIKWSLKLMTTLDKELMSTKLQRSYPRIIKYSSIQLQCFEMPYSVVWV